MSAEAPALTLVVAPDSFKGSCTSQEAAEAIAAGVSSVFGDQALIRKLPMADGGEGTLETLVEAWGGTIGLVPVTDALGRPRTGRVGLGRTPGAGVSAIIEAADANGLPAVSDVPLRPLDADSFGVGTLILEALDAGAEEILLCVGGSATNDGGTGMLRALGARLLDDDGNEVPPGAGGLGRVHEVDLSALDPRVTQTTWRVACDVDNPLLGPRGAAAVFGPQKGANDADIEVIDSGLERLLVALAGAAGRSYAHLRELPGLGAAGGLALGPLLLFGAQLMPGAQLVSEAIGLRGALSDARFVITGEGRLDRQSLDGKVVSQVVADAGPGTAVLVLAGSLGLNAAECREAGISAAFSIAPGAETLAELQRDCLRLLEEAAAQLSGAILAARHSS